MFTYKMNSIRKGNRYRCIFFLCHFDFFRKKQNWFSSRKANTVYILLPQLSPNTLFFCREKAVMAFLAFAKFDLYFFYFVTFHTTGFCYTLFNYKLFPYTLVYNLLI